MSPNLPCARFLNSLRQPRFSVPVLLLLACTRLSGIDFTEGVLTALPVRDGKPPAIDGALGDWDLSAQEPVYISAQTAAHMNAEWAFMYDDDAFYVSARVAMPMRSYRNPSGPQDAFWSHDLIQMRLVADPAQAYPLNAQRDAQNDRVAHLSFWQNSYTGGSYLQITRGTKLNLGKVLNPQGSEVAFGHDTTAGFTVIEAKIPWSALNVPGGKNPFKPGDKTAAVIETLWIGGDSSRVAAGFRQDPGSFAFLNPHTWGQLQFAEKSPGKRIRPTLKSILTGLEQSKRREPGSPVGVPISFDVPEDDLKASVNILGANGEVLRELVGGETFAKGRQTVKWDGRDAWGRSLPPGNYSWGAYLHRGLKAEFVGSVGTAGTPPFPTADGRGGWGGDHSNPVACAADASGIYLLWPVSEAGKALVKIDQDGRVIWRQNPFVGGGFGPFFAIATDGRHVYLTRGTTEVFLVRLDAKTGALLTWGEGGPSEFPLYKSSLKSLPSAVAPVEVHDSRIHMQLDPGHVIHPDPVGLAVHDGRIYVSHYSQDKILVIDAATGKQLGELSCPGPRGLAVDQNGLLYAASYKPDFAAQVMRFDPKSAQPTVMISRGLEAPYGIAVTEDGRIYVSDTGASQQIKLFSADGKPQKAIGTKGGRPWQGRYDPDAFLNPAGLTLDKDGALIVAESSPPKVFSRFSASGDKLMDRWFGPGVYWNSTWPMPEDPTHVFYLLNEAIGRARISGPETPGIPDAYWDPARAGFPQVGNIEKNFPTPTTLRADNGKLYLVGDIGRHAIFLFENDVVRPVATWLPISANNPDASGKGPGLDVWVDANADGLVQPNEKSILTKMPDGSALGSFAEMVGSMRMEPNGDLFFVTHQNRVLKVPAKSFDARGQISWDIARISWAIPEVLPGAKSMPTSWRMGILGVDRDSAGNYYTGFNTRVSGKNGAFDYPSEKVAAKMMNGMGHTSTFNIVKFAKYDAAGRLLWMAGRKATGGEQPGEMYHFWNLSGVINDRYVAGGSEWGRIYFYTHDGFYVDALMNNPGEISAPGPYTFGGETSGAQVRYFPKTGEVWAYSTGMAFRVNGFTAGRVEGERRLSGSVVLDKVYELPVDAAETPSGPLVIATLKSDPANNDDAWNGLSPAVLRKDGAKLAEAWLGLFNDALHARIHVVDASPLQNGATDLQLAFKGGDTAGIVLGGVGATDNSAPGGMRLMAALIGDKPRLIAMKPTTLGQKQPFDYYTPAAGKAHFDYVGEVPGATVRLTPTDDGYVAAFSVPLNFFEFKIAPGTKLRGDVEVRLSGTGGRGLQATSRNYLFTPPRPETTMTDDIPTESRLYPAHWGTVDVR